LLSNLANRQTDRQTPAIAFTFSFVGSGNKSFNSTKRRAQSTDRHEASRGIFATAELLVANYYGL